MLNFVDFGLPGIIFRHTLNLACIFELLDKTLYSVDTVSKEIFQKMWEPPPITDTSRAE
jgi:hypothetical protein